MGATSGAVTAYLSRAPEFYPVFTCISGARFVHVVKFNVSRLKFRFVMYASISSQKRCLVHLDSHLFCWSSCFINVICIYFARHDFQIR